MGAIHEWNKMKVLNDTVDGDDEEANDEKIRF
jgi:hypothetical protein